MNYVRALFAHWAFVLLWNISAKFRAHAEETFRAAQRHARWKLRYEVWLEENS